MGAGDYAVVVAIRNSSRFTRPRVAMSHALATRAAQTKRVKTMIHPRPDPGADRREEVYRTR